MYSCVKEKIKMNLTVWIHMLKNIAHCQDLHEANIMFDCLMNLVHPQHNGLLLIAYRRVELERRGYP